MNNVRRTPTEDCPLTKENYSNFLDVDCCKCGFKTIISIFVVLTAAITIALFLQLVYQGGLNQYHVDYHGAVATDSANCSLIGTKILHKGGNAVDAAIAAALCTTVLLPHKTGLGGGGYIMIYNPKYGNDPVLIDFAQKTIKGDLSEAKVRIPALLKGLDYVHSLYGTLPWKDLVEPTINLATNGFVISQELSLQSLKSDDQFYGKRIHAGDVMKLPILADTLSMVASEGVQALYNGTLIGQLLHPNVSSWKDLSKDDLLNYKPVKRKAKMSSTFYNYKIIYPSHASLLKNIIEEINRMNIPLENASSVDAQAQIINMFIRLNKDAHYTGEEGRYTGVVSIDGGNTFVCVLSGMNSPLSGQFMTAAGFALDVASQSDYLNSLVPVVFYNAENKCKLLGTFGTDDQMLISQVLYKLVVRSLNITQAIESSRYYVYNDRLSVENDDTQAEDAALRQHLKTIFQLYPADETSIMKSVNIIIKRYKLISSHSDSRGEGIAYRF